VSAPMPWFRLYNRIIDDTKLKLLAFEDRWHFVALCCLKSSGLIDKPDTDLRTREIAVALGVQLRELDEISRRLREVGLVDEHLNPLAWDELQFKSDNSTARVQEYREKLKNQSGNSTKRSRNVSVTAQETETDTDTETEVLEAKASCASDDALKPAHVAEEWNKVAQRIWGRRMIRDITPARRQLCQARIAQYSIQDFVAVFGKVEGSPFLRGERKWSGATFDWTLKRANFQKIIEGNYDG
jgi:hypothetical protein